MSNKQAIELENLRTELIGYINMKFDELIQRGNDNEESEVGRICLTLPLSSYSGLFRGKKPVAVIFRNGEEVLTPTWKKVVACIIKDCINDENKHKAILAMREVLTGRQRVILSADKNKLDIPIQITEELYMEGRYDAESLIRIMKKTILECVNYDINNVSIKYWAARK